MQSYDPLAARDANIRLNRAPMHHAPMQSRDPLAAGDAKGGKAAAKSPADKGKDKGGKGGAIASPGGLDGVFTLSASAFDLKVDETQELTIYAFPTEVSRSVFPVKRGVQHFLHIWRVACKCNALF